MNRDALKIFIAFAIGAAVGTVVAMDVNRYFWWLGLLVGGATGYLSYEWRAVIHAIPAAYRAAGRIKLPSKSSLLCRFRFFVWGSAATLSFGAWMCIAFSPLQPLALRGEVVLGGLCVLLMLGCCLIATIFTFVVVIITLAGGAGSSMDEFTDTFREITYIVSPPTVVFWHLPRGVCFVARKTPHAVAATLCFALSVLILVPRGIVAAASFCMRFGWQMFVRIHSERRLICGVDMLLGSVVGHFVGKAAIGALAGGILGVVNYAIVTKRWLRPRGYIRAR